jgi:ABC-type nitrate/sulfonate/bicarbonate transport system substrate-binding protein
MAPFFDDFEVKFISPHHDGYAKTPHQLVREGLADIGIGPSETVISNYLQDKSIIAVAALNQNDDSAIVTLKSSGIDTMAKMDGKRYASYSARFEGRIVQRMIQYAGGSGNYQELSPAKLGVFDTLLDGSHDATWVFMHHEGVQAELRGVELNVFKLSDHGVEYGYPLVVFKSRSESGNDAAVRAFLHQAQKAYEWAVANRSDAAEMMIQQVEKLFPDLALDHEQVRKSVQLACETFLDGQGHAMCMEEAKWAGFVSWLYDAGLMTTNMQSRGPAGGGKTSLDGLRGSDAGDPLPRDAVRTSELFTTDYLLPRH